MAVSSGSAASDIKINIKATDMDEDTIKRVTEIAVSAINSHRHEKNIAHYIKYEFDKFLGYGWNCIVGRNFGSHIIHQTNKYIFFNVKELYILLWKA